MYAVNQKLVLAGEKIIAAMLCDVVVVVGCMRLRSMPLAMKKELHGSLLVL